MAPPSQTVAPPKAASGPQTFGDLPVVAKVALAVIIFAMLSAGYYFGFHMDLADQIDAAEARHTQLVRDRQEAEQRQQEFVRVSQQLVEREPVDRRNRRILPENAEMAAFLGDINRLAELSGLGIEFVQPMPEQTDTAFVRVPVKLKLNGQYHQFAKFFHAVSQLDRIVSMENIKVDSVQTQRTTQAPTGRATVPVVALRVEVDATTFRRPAPAAAPPGPRPAAPGGRG